MAEEGMTEQQLEYAMAECQHGYHPDSCLTCLREEVKRLRDMRDYARRMADSYQRRITKAEGVGLSAWEQRAIWAALRNVLDCG